LYWTSLLTTVLQVLLVVLYPSDSQCLLCRFPFSAADRSSDQLAPREALASRAIQFPFVVLALQVVADIFACVRFGPREEITCAGR
jgi:hypothetical protein